MKEIISTNAIASPPIDGGGGSYNPCSGCTNSIARGSALMRSCSDCAK